MITKKKHFLLFLFIWTLFFSKETVCQNLYLKVVSTDKKQQQVLENINYLKTHINENKIHNECKKISSYLKKQGYFTNTIDNIIKQDSLYNCYISLKRKIKVIGLIYENDFKFLDTIFLKPNKTGDYLSRIISNLDSKGDSFSKTFLSDNIIKKDTLFSFLNITPSKVRTIDKVIIKGYNTFPKKFIRNHLLIKERKTIFSKKKLKEISNNINSLPFAKSIKSSETLFKKDSTLLYLYLEKKQNNSFDGLINFTTKEDGGVLFNGILDIQLNNIFNKGTFFALNWNAIGDERQELKIKLETPYIFNSRITPKLFFNIYRQDSTFINTKFSSLLNYSINSKVNVGVSLLKESSESTLESNQSNNTSFNSFFSGIQFIYRISNENELLDDKFYLSINPLIGNRNTLAGKQKQFKINTIISYTQKINTINYIFIKNNTGILNSDNFLNNELFRIGGANSIRGFNEQSFFTSNYSYFNIEYRYLSSKTSYFYSITDIGRLIISSKKNNVIGLGLGYSFINKNSKINLSIALGNNLSNKFQFRNPKFIVNWKVFF